MVFQPQQEEVQYTLAGEKRQDDAGEQRGSDEKGAHCKSLTNRTLV